MTALTVSDVSLRARGRWHTLAAAAVIWWMLVGVGVAVAHRFGASVAWWDVVHTFTVGAVTTAVIVYSTHFVEALTRTGAGRSTFVAIRVGIIQVALIALLVDRAGYDWGVLSDVAAGAVIAVLLWHIAVIVRRLRGSLAGRFAVTVPFYVAAAAFLILAILLAALAGNGVGDYSDLIGAHSRATVWGFSWLTVLGTVVTLLPTLSSTPISEVARRRCTRALSVHCAGLTAAVLLQALGLTEWAGAAQLLTVLAAVMVAQPIVATMFAGQGRWTTAAASVTAGLVWLIALSAADAASLIGGADARATTVLLAPSFLGGGLLQLVTGVLHHLLPTLIGGGPDKVRRARSLADRGGYARTVLLNLGALLALLAADGPAKEAGLILLGLGLAGHVMHIIRAVVAQYRMENL